MARVTNVALAALLVLVSGAAGVEQKETAKNRPVGVWKRTLGDHSITFTIKGDTLHAVVKAGDNTMEIDADYGISKDDVLFARINKSNRDGNGPSEGDLFSFRFKVDNKTLTVSALKTPHDSAEGRELVQGEYQKQKANAE